MEIKKNCYNCKKKFYIESKFFNKILKPIKYKNKIKYICNNEIKFKNTDDKKYNYIFNKCKTKLYKCQKCLNNFDNICQNCFHEIKSEEIYCNEINSFFGIKNKIPFVKIISDHYCLKCIEIKKIDINDLTNNDFDKIEENFYITKTTKK